MESLWKWMKKERGLLLFSFVAVFLKKWEPGGHIDATWYSTVARNIALSGDFFHFSINPHFVPKLFDHFPLDYWIMGGLMSVFGVSDLTARFYFMVCSFTSLLLLFFMARNILGKGFGYAAVVTFILCLGATKWSGAIKHDVPLTLAYLACTYFFFKSFKDPKYLIGVAPFFVFGVFAKGPVIFGFPLALLLWTLWQRDFKWFLKKEFAIGMTLLFALMALPFLPILHFDGKNYYEIFFNAKKSYLNVGETSEDGFFFYWIDLIKRQPHVFLLLLASVFVLWKKKIVLTEEQTARFKFLVCLVLAILIPLSFFQFKLAYYSLPAIPFYATLAAISLHTFAQHKSWDWSKGLFRLSLLVMIVMLAFPLKTTGGRHKRVTNVVNQVKMLSQINSIPTYFLGYYDEDMSIFQEFKFYGGVDLIPSKREELLLKDPKEIQLVVLRRDLPVQVGDKSIETQDCWILNSQYCVYLSPEKVKLSLPDWKWPHEDYGLPSM